MYYNKNLVQNINDWYIRVQNSTLDNFQFDLKFLLKNIEDNATIKGIITEAEKKYFLNEQELKKLDDDLQFQFYEIGTESLEHRASICYQVTKYLAKKYNFNIHRLTHFYFGNYHENQKRICSDLILPFLQFIADSLENHNSIVYLLEKYKKRTEWFTAEKLLNQYTSQNKNYEDSLEDDLRMFLFDQGIDYPFSTPKSKSGRADIVGNINTSDPLIIEIKIFDRQKKYGKHRISEGFTQIRQYTENYNKTQGFLVIFNFDKAQINLDLNGNKGFYPPMLTINHKNYYFIVIDVAERKSASKIGKSDMISVTQEDLIQ
ncbi:hypothetical protein C7S20_12675 [Christiangramia fulva]|uniref:Uncharacterized protein n=1 Tax=Christiangramia fulva TaxID=2126553 RepID=A0A2R3Z710_9FLAO|nr:hypothetical protein [Christiangramia fulva]AVR46039.1 hypothetical protein C7S20_12675 [Christiangramia fulva]